MLGSDFKPGFEAEAGRSRLAIPPTIIKLSLWFIRRPQNALVSEEFNPSLPNIPISTPLQYEVQPGDKEVQFPDIEQAECEPISTSSRVSPQNSANHVLPFIEITTEGSATNQSSHQGTMADTHMDEASPARAFVCGKSPHHYRNFPYGSSDDHSEGALARLKSSSKEPWVRAFRNTLFSLSVVTFHSVSNLPSVLRAANIKVKAALSTSLFAKFQFTHMGIRSHSAPDASVSNMHAPPPSSLVGRGPESISAHAVGDQIKTSVTGWLVPNQDGQTSPKLNRDKGSSFPTSQQASPFSFDSKIRRDDHPVEGPTLPPTPQSSQYACSPL
nr:hypothetical protein Iba_chr12bCG0590 [Ipomoea batatas]